MISPPYPLVLNISWCWSPAVSTDFLDFPGWIGQSILQVQSKRLHARQFCGSKSTFKGARRISLDHTLNTRLAHPLAEMWQRRCLGGLWVGPLCRNLFNSRHYIGTDYLRDLSGGSGGPPPGKFWKTEPKICPVLYFWPYLP